ncbi:MAG: phosphoglucosamine mutase [Deltaproteobacteria bacterium]|nr:phosphoglucosamine mutase [Deltaproteobacteria bacterium]
MNAKLFGTDGVRGLANVHPMTAEMALALGQAIAYVFRGRSGGGGDHRIVIGKDTRLSGYMFEDALAAGICSMGVNVIQIGPMPTPALAFLTADMRCDAGVMISASHNAYQDNGIKFFAQDGFKLPDEIEARIESLIDSDELRAGRASASELGQARRIDDAAGRYMVFLKNTFPMDLTLNGLRVVLDCANGAGYKVGPTVLWELGAELFTLGCDPNGRNINDGCGSLYPQKLADRVREVRADVGIALDGDADRLLLVNEKGEEVDGDMILGLCAKDMKERKCLKGQGVVSTVMSNMGLEKVLEAEGLHLVRTQVGDRYVVEAMRREGYNLGGEQSGHMIFLDHSRTGDGLMSALQVLAIMARGGRRLSELTADFQRFPQVLHSIRVAEKKPLESLPSMQAAIQQVESELADRGRVLIRYSGTEPVVRIMVEAEDESRVQSFSQHLIEELKRALGAEGESR